MTTRTRKAPDRQSGSRAAARAAPRGGRQALVRDEPGLMMTLARQTAGAGLGLLTARPRETVLAAGFLVAFGWVSANALWYQPGNHPSPFLMTRDSKHSAALAGWTDPGPPPENPDAVTYRIEREPADGTVAEAGGGALVSDAEANAELIRGVQRELIRRGLMSGTPDGVLGPQTLVAVQHYEKKAGLPVSGLVTPELLAAMLTESSAPKLRVADRPAEVADPAAQPDPVAAAILSAEQPVLTASVEKPAKPGSSLLSEAELVLSIQKGLTNMAYQNVAIDGVAGKETRAAIRHFERHYNLPETGEPSLAVLQKLKAIGAL